MVIFCGNLCESNPIENVMKRVPDYYRFVEQPPEVKVNPLNFMHSKLTLLFELPFYLLNKQFGQYENVCKNKDTVLDIMVAC